MLKKNQEYNYIQAQRNAGWYCAALLLSFSHTLWQYRTANLLQIPVFFHFILVMYYHDWCATTAAASGFAHIFDIARAS